MRDPRPVSSGTTRPWLRWLASTLATVPIWCSAQMSMDGCGDLHNGVGPFDYRTERGSTFETVNGAHFTPVVEMLIRGSSSGSPGGDIDYTLRAYPNHHRALDATVRLSVKEKTDKPRGMRYVVDCWFKRAIRFRPDDLTVRMMYSNYLSKSGRADEAQPHLRWVAATAGDNPFTRYNLGLVLFELKQFEQAAEQARLARSLGFPRMELIERLKAAGHWKEIADPPADASSQPASEPLAQDPASAPR